MKREVINFITTNIQDYYFIFWYNILFLFIASIVLSVLDHFISNKKYKEHSAFIKPYIVGGGILISIICAVYAILIIGAGTIYKVEYSHNGYSIILSPYIESIILIANLTMGYLYFKNNTMSKLAIIFNLFFTLFVGSSRTLVSIMPKFEEMNTSKVAIRPWLFLNKKWSSDDKWNAIYRFELQEKPLVLNQQKIHSLYGKVDNLSIEEIHNALLNIKKQALLELQNAANTVVKEMGWWEWLTTTTPGYIVIGVSAAAVTTAGILIYYYFFGNNPGPSGSSSGPSIPPSSGSASPAISNIVNPSAEDIAYNAVTGLAVTAAVVSSTPATSNTPLYSASTIELKYEKLNDLLDGMKRTKDVKKNEETAYNINRLVNYLRTQLDDIVIAFNDIVKKSKSTIAELQDKKVTPINIAKGNIAEKIDVLEDETATLFAKLNMQKKHKEINSADLEKDVSYIQKLCINNEHHIQSLYTRLILIKKEVAIVTGYVYEALEQEK